ncbi:Cytochrome-C7 domain-containing protein [Sulfidibacter corallicola]|uniref:Cytochrome c7 n=1 Tax=Sulfidibacter corallicola TaxID=2818388 RepID=A0A8A4TQG6_SULCO|nr:cytochrome c3 family protein [Sulfidibacter corallicola]QTD51332.1 hypothetical protein J3U87_02590 [Sulfidibacter corallicola]
MPHEFFVPSIPHHRRRRATSLWAISLLLLTVSTGCVDLDPPHPSRVKDTIAANEGHAEEPEAAHLIADVTRVPVSLPGSVSPEDYFVETRADQLMHAPCAQCHSDAIPLENEPKAHWDIELQHAGSDTMTCTTCHDPDKHMESLAYLKGGEVPFDHSYRLCGQCHFEQLRDWDGGSHGKRVAAWAGDRIVRNCTGCHDPHRPAFPKRWPVHNPSPTETRLMDGDGHDKESSHE